MQLINTITLLVRNSSLASARRGFVLIALALAGFALSPHARALLPPPAPDGGYPNQNTAEGENALFNLTDDGTDNTGIGFKALYNITIADRNTAIGSLALYNIVSGSQNTASGFQALYSNVSGFNNTATGALALYFNRGRDNTATGAGALYFNSTGYSNTATGASALHGNTTGFGNTAAGLNALFYNTTGSYNTAAGLGALVHNTTGSSNTAQGLDALFSNTIGHYNTAQGYKSLFRSTTGSYNIALGMFAGQNLTKGNNNIMIGNDGVAGEADDIRIGTKETHQNTFIAGISGVTVAGGVAVIIDANGHLGTVNSSERFKDEIKPMDKASEAILSLKPVTFRYKQELDPKGIPQFGLVAEEVEKINPDLVVRDADGKVYTVRYEAVNAMLLNEFLKEHRNVEQLEGTVAQQQKDSEAMVAELRKEITALTASLKERASQIKQVNARLALIQPAEQVAISNQ
jgi:hypothetical protein